MIIQLSVRLVSNNLFYLIHFFEGIEAAKERRKENRQRSF